MTREHSDVGLSNVMPFGIETSLVAFDRATKFAKGLFKADDAVVILTQDGQHWRSRYTAGRFPPKDPGASIVIETGQPLWLEDAREDERFCNDILVVGPPYIRGYAAAPIRLPDGTTPGALTVISTRPFPYDAENAERLLALAEIVADEWERAQLAHAHRVAMEEIVRSAARLDLALTLAETHVFELDYQAQALVTAGARDTIFFGSPRVYDDLVGDIYTTVDERDVDHVKASWAAHRRTGAPFLPEYRIRRDDDKEVWVQSAFQYFEDENKRPVRLVGALKNITERKLIERNLTAAKDAAEAANQAKSAFLATMSHEIRTPLNGVLGMAQAMAVDDLSTGQRERLEVIRTSGESLLAILNDVLDLSKIEMGKLELEETEFDIDELARGAHAAFTALADAKDLRFTLDIARGARGRYRGDSTRVRQILYNLLSNAVKFTSAGGVRVDVKYVRRALVLTVVDDGIGMSEDTIARLFGRFEQADTSTTRKFGGTGLGLSICHELTNLMAGSISVQSCPGEGSTFTVRLPLQKLAGFQRAKGRREPRAPQSDQRVRILAAEDNPVNQLVLEALLGQADVDLVMVSDGRAAVEACENETWSLVLMDIQMPVMDGVTATRLIRARELSERRVRTPILALTANAMSHQRAEYLSQGMDGFVAKPIVLADLFAAIEKALTPTAGAAAGFAELAQSA